MSADAILILRLGSAVLIGLLVGLQREHHNIEQPGSKFAGLRTFGLIGLAGALAALAADTLGQPIAWSATLFVVGSLLVAGYIAEAARDDVGGTSQIAAIITFIAGGLCYWDQLAVAAAVGVATTLILETKLETHRFAKALSREDMIAVVKFAAITALVLPVLPNRVMGPEPIHIINPFNTWLLVVLISGIGFLGYTLVQVFGPRLGIGLTGLVGGLVSSTAVTMSFAQRSKESSGLERALALAVIVSWTTMYGRIALEVAVTNRPLLARIALPLTLMALVGLGHVAWLYLRGHDTKAETPKFDNPFGLTPAITFGALYLVIKIAAHLGQLWLGDAGLYASSIVAGIADVDAITLSVSQLSVAGESLSLDTAGRAILMATLSNTVVKGAMVAFIGSKAMRRAISPGVVMLLLIGVLAIWLV